MNWVGKVCPTTLINVVTQRHRSSPYPMLSVSEATEQILSNTQILSTISLPVNENLVGYILAEDVHAPESVPAFRASIVDGYAVICTAPPHTNPASDGEGTYPVTQISTASASSLTPLTGGQIARITTGAPLPDGADAVIMVEDTLVTSETEGGEEKQVRLLAKIATGENIREIGSDVQRGDLILHKGDEITFAGGEVGILASVGIGDIKVYRKPVVGVLSTGNELVSHSEGRELRLGEVRDSNRPSLLAALKAWGYSGVDLGIASDTYLPFSH
jgi:gephyrin